MTDDGWAERLERELAAGDGRSARRVLDGVTGDRASRDDALDQLAARAAEGSPLAVELLAEVVDEWGLARAGVERVLVDEAAVDDVTQDTLVAMARSVRSFRGDSRFVTWLFNVARYRAVDHLRRQRATEPLDDDDVGEARRISSIIANRKTVQQSIEQLPDRYRRAVQLRDIERLSYADVAERLDLNVNTVKSHVARGRALLARMLDGQEL